MNKFAWLLLAVAALAAAQVNPDALRARARNGDSAAQAALGVAYETGAGVPQNETAAVQWFRKAAQQGNAVAESHLARMYHDGRGGLARDDVQAALWYRKAAEQGNPQAQTSLGMMYNEGRGPLPKDPARAVYWTRKAADQGEPQAESNLGLLYFTGGGGLPKDESQALYWWRKAADQGNAAGQDGAAWIFATSHDPQLRNPAAALDYARKAVNSSKGHPEYLDTLAEAYFVNRQFQNAVETEQQAIASAPPERKPEYEKNLAKYNRALSAGMR